MKKSLLFVFSISLTLQCAAQIGLSAGYKTFNAKDWNAAVRGLYDDEPYPMTGWQVGADYWFRLKKRRIEFTPELTFSKFKKEYDTGSLEHLELGLHFNTAVYIFDLASDCNCPTFSKDGNFFSKGFFLEVSPGAIFLQNNRIASGAIFTDFKGDEFSFGGSVGAGLDFGFSDVFTITPIFRYYIYSKVDWNYSLTIADSATDLTQLFLGVRFRLHIKEIKKARYR